MADKSDRIIKEVYRKWKAEDALHIFAHPDDELWACFHEGKLSAEEMQELKIHLVSCDACSVIFAAQVKLNGAPEKECPPELQKRIEASLREEEAQGCLEIILKLKSDCLELIRSSGAVLIGQELIPAPLLRSRNLTEFKDQVTMLKDFQDLTVEVKIENKKGVFFTCAVTARDQHSRNNIKNLRVSLTRDTVELESYVSDSGIVVFEHVSPGVYSVAVSSLKGKLASIFLDIHA